ncbi:hypothetical protein LEL_02920 [Akanthomyces lecanii RCEF 1005]|uniref:Uncharacterized protein n=1 Tax=Akanthomyces lecanii RCEF 1005 TaxID=1081108 RepID=A0A168IME6_CORDF|nr:hypothetical protein LEL_02920 [Akanthomyces lecanii RCEF 1005]
MCFQTIKYECGHEKEEVLDCSSRTGLYGLFMNLYYLLYPGETDPLPCDTDARVYVYRSNDCQRCLRRSIPALRKRERRLRRTLRGDFVDYSDQSERSASPRPISRRQPAPLRPRGSIENLHEVYEELVLPEYAQAASNRVDESDSASSDSDASWDAASEPSTTLKSRRTWYASPSLVPSTDLPSNDSMESFACITAQQLEESAGPTKIVSRVEW